MTLLQLLHSLRAENADCLTIFAAGNAVLYTKDQTLRFHSLADLEKAFSGGTSPASPTPCTCGRDPKPS